MAQFATLTELLAHRAQEQADTVSYLFIDGHSSPPSLTYQELHRRASQLAGELIAKEIRPQEIAILILPPGLELIVAFFGCLLANVIPVIIQPPINQPLYFKFTSILTEVDAKMILLSPALSQTIYRSKHFSWLRPFQKYSQWIERATHLSHFLPHLKQTPSIIVDLNSPLPAGTETDLPEVHARDVALIQYTSGSTANPRGVTLHHSHLLHNLDIIARALGTHHSSFSWLPPYHDMGLIGGILQPFYAGYQSILMAPSHFLRHPDIWLKLITDYRITNSGAPNFAYEYCANKIDDEQLSEFDLSCWEVAFNGSESIYEQTLKKFSRKFKACGFNKNAFYLAYGLAEATLFVSGGFYKPEETLYLDKEHLKNNGVTITSEDTSTTMSFVSQGKPAEPLLIVDQETHHPLPEDRIGEIWLDSPSIAVGYWQNPQATDITFHARIPGQNKNHLQTGDLGFIHRQRLYITGRTKDLIIIHGENYYPHDIEYSVGQCHTKIRKGRVMTLGVTVDLQERLVIIAEVYSARQTKYDETLHAIKTNLSTNYSIRPHDIVLIKARQIPVTTSGKINHSKGRQMYLNNEFDVVARQKTTVNASRQKSDRYTDPLKPTTLIKSIVEEVIGQSIQNPRESLFTYPITSIEIAALIDRIEQAYHVTIPLQRITTNLSIDSLQKLVQANHLTTMAFQAKPLIDNYPLNLSVSSKPRTFHYRPSTVLLTGADDFLGVHLLNKLLTCTDLNIICFISIHQELPDRYLCDQVMKYDLQDSYDATRVTAIAVDFGKPRFGLNPERLKEIVHCVDAIYHCAENSNWVLPLPLLEEVNTLATKQLIELFNLKKTVPIHYMSTLVPFLFDLSGKSAIYEESYPQWENLLTGYSQSKWLSEQLLNQARSQQGIPINIYRMGLVSNRLANGRIKITDFLPRLLKTVRQINSLPLENTNLELISIDYLSEWIVNLSQQEEALSHNFHLLHKNKLTIDVLETILSHYFGPVKRIPYRQWVRRICEDEEIALYPLRPFLKMITPGLLADHLQIKFSDRNAERIRQQCFPKLAEKESDTEKILISLLDYLTEHHYL